MLGNIKDILTNLNYNLSGNGPLVYQLAALNNALGEDGVLGDIVEALGEDGIAGVLESILEQLGEIAPADYSEYFEDIVEALGALDAIAEAFGEDGAIAQLVDALEGIEQELGEDGAIAGQLADLVEGIVGDGGTNDILQAIVDALSDEDTGLPAIVEAIGENGDALDQIVEALVGSDDPETGDHTDGLIDVLEDLKDEIGDQNDKIDDIIEAIEELIDKIDELINGDDDDPDSPEHPTGEIDGESYVQLDEDVKVAVENVGADSPTELGGLFAWGEVKEKTTFTLDNYKYWESAGSKAIEGRFTKYNDVDKLTTLTISDDAAAQNMSENWRMMTVAEVQSFLDDTKYEITFTDDYNESGVAGMIVTSLVEPFAGNYVFFPGVDDGGYATSSIDQTLPDDYSGAKAFKVRNNELSIGGAIREMGFYVRGIVGTAPEDPEPPVEEPNSPDNPSGYYNGIPYVTLATGFEWATYDIGAKSPAGIGDAFAWGEVEPKTQYTWNTYVFSPYVESLVDWRSINKYQINDGNFRSAWYDAGSKFIGDGKTRLDQDDEAKYEQPENSKKIWGMPYAEDFRRLIGSKEFEWKEGSYNGKSGYIVTSLAGDYAGNWIFFPISAKAVDFPVLKYWSQDLSEDHTAKAQAMVLYDGEMPKMSNEWRKDGLQIRGIVKRQDPDQEPLN